MQKLLFIMMLPVVFGTQACTQKAVYDEIRANRAYACSRVPEAEREGCLQGTDDTYDEYQRKRQEALKD